MTDMTQAAVPDPDAHLPHEPARGQPAPGWRPDWRNPALELWWTGKRWHGSPRPRPLPAGPGGVQPQVVYVQAPGYGTAQPARPQYLSGISTGEKVVHVVLSVCTLGLWLPVWGLRALLSRRRIR
jgi:hypothetical protein